MATTFPTYRYFENTVTTGMSPLRAIWARGESKAKDWLLSNGFYRNPEGLWAKHTTDVRYRIELRHGGAVAIKS